MILFKPVQEPNDPDSRMGRAMLHWIMYRQGQLSEPTACLSDEEARKLAVAWLRQHPTSAKALAEQQWFGNEAE